MPISIDDIEEVSPAAAPPSRVSAPAVSRSGPRRLTIDEIDETDLPTQKSNSYEALNRPADDYVAKAEQKHGLPEGMLRSIRDNGEKSGSQAISRKGALGRFQFMPQTAKEMGLDDPTNDVKAADAAGKYVSKLYQQYKSKFPNATDSQLWAAAISHYNGGASQGELAVAGKKPSYKETSGYLDRVRAGIPALAQIEGSGVDGGAGGRRALTIDDLEEEMPFNSPQHEGMTHFRPAAPRPGKDEPGFMQPGSRSSALVQGLSNAATLGTSHYIAPAFTTVWDKATGEVPGETWKQAYERNLEQERQLLETNRNLRPGYTLTGDLAGGFVLPVGAAAGATSLLGRAGRMAAVGAGQGAARGAAEKNLERDSTGRDVAGAALEGGLVGGAVGGAIPVAGAAVGYVGKKAADALDKSKAGNWVVNRFGDVNAATGERIQKTATEVMADKSGIGSFTPEGRSRLIESQLSKEMRASTPVVVETRAVTNPDGGVSIQNVPHVRYDSRGRVLMDSLDRGPGELKVDGPLAGKVVYGDPVLPDKAQIYKRNPPERELERSVDYTTREVNKVANEGKYPGGYLDSVDFADNRRALFSAYKKAREDAEKAVVDVPTYMRNWWGKDEIEVAGVGGAKPTKTNAGKYYLDREKEILDRVRAKTGSDDKLKNTWENINHFTSKTPEELSYDAAVRDVTRWGSGKQIRPGYGSKIDPRVTNNNTGDKTRGTVSDALHDSLAANTAVVGSHPFQENVSGALNPTEAALKGEPLYQGRKVDPSGNGLVDMHPVDADIRAAMAASLSNKAKEQAKGTAGRAVKDAVTGYVLYKSESFGMPTAARDALMGALGVTHGIRTVKDLAGLAYEVVPDSLKAYNLAIASGKKDLIDTATIRMAQAVAKAVKASGGAAFNVGARSRSSLTKTVLTEKERKKHDARIRDELLGRGVGSDQRSGVDWGSVGKDPYDLLGGQGRDPYESLK